MPGSYRGRGYDVAGDALGPFCRERWRLGDALEYASLEDQVDRHWRWLGAVALSMLLAVGTELNSGTDTVSTDTTSSERYGVGRGIRSVKPVSRCFRTHAWAFVKDCCDS